MATLVCLAIAIFVVVPSSLPGSTFANYPEQEEIRIGKKTPFYLNLQSRLSSRYPPYEGQSVIL